jgi:dsRNA-specific ribonuclease
MNNIKNKIITKRFIEDLVNNFLINKTFKVKNIKLYQSLFVQKTFYTYDEDNSDSDTYCNIIFDKYDNISTNERYEFLGDKVIDFVTTELLFDKYPDKDEGFLTKLKSKIVRKKSLASLGEKLGFKEFMLIGSNIERSSGRDNIRFLEDIFESFIGGLYKDQKSNIDLTREFILGVYDAFIDFENLNNTNDNYKDSLLRYFHSKSYGNPVYTHVYNTEGVNKEFYCILTLSTEIIDFCPKIKHCHDNVLQFIRRKGYNKDLNGLVIIGMGNSDTKKEAEQICSQICLKNLKVPLDI